MREWPRLAACLLQMQLLPIAHRSWPCSGFPKSSAPAVEGVAHCATLATATSWHGRHRLKQQDQLQGSCQPIHRSSNRRSQQPWPLQITMQALSSPQAEVQTAQQTSCCHKMNSTGTSSKTMMEKTHSWRSPLSKLIAQPHRCVLGVNKFAHLGFEILVLVMRQYTASM